MRNSATTAWHVDRARTAVIGLFVGMLPSVCHANAAAPGPLMYYGALNTGAGLWWLVISMVTCVLVEGLLFQVAHVFRRPYLVSLLLNTVSLVAGIPLAFVGAIVDFMITATALTIVTETLVAVGMRSMRTINGVVTSGSRTVLAVLGANTLSNVLLFFLLVWMSREYPPRWVFEKECSENIHALKHACYEYITDHEGSNNSSATTSAVLQYLQQKRMPLCPFGGHYTVDIISTNATCSHTSRNKVKQANDPDR